MNKQENAFEKLEWISSKMEALNKIKENFCVGCSRADDCLTLGIPACISCPYSDFYEDVSVSVDDAVTLYNKIAKQTGDVNE